MGVEITNKTLGVIGCGNIGSIVADRAQGLRMRVIAYDPFLSPERARDLGVEKVELAGAVQARRLHHAAHAAHRQDQEHRRRRLDRDHEEGRAHHQLRARRAGRRGGAARGARFRPGGGRRLRRVRRGAGEGKPAVRPSERGLHAASRRLDHRRRRRTSRCRSPSRCPTTCSTARSPTPSTSRRSRAEEAPKLKPFVALAEKLGSFAGQLTETGLSKVQIAYEGQVAA